MSRLKRLTVNTLALLLLTGLQAVYAQDPLTGTRLRAAGTASPRTSIQFGEPDEVAQIRNKLEADKTDEALQLALGYVEQTDKAGRDTLSRFYARNSLCAVYTVIRELEKAEQECSRAVELMPAQWSGWNNRGTARYLAGDMIGAQQDFLRALEQAGDQQGVVDLLRHNLSLLDVPAPALE